MKVVLFCGGLGTRLKEYSTTIPKPMVEIGYRPIMWHLMKYYAHYGHNEFILCLGYGGDIIKHYFLNYNECLSNDFVLSNGGQDIQLYKEDMADWKITFVDTGQQSNIGQRLKAVQKYLGEDEVFMANYSDGLTNVDLNEYLTFFEEKQKVASFLAVQPSQSFHLVKVADDELVKSIEPASQSSLWINGGFFIFKKSIFNYMRDGEELVHEPFKRLIDAQQLMAYKHPGYWACMDTFKEKSMFDAMYDRGETPWAVWQQADANRASVLKAYHLNGNGMRLQQK
ncbi:MAG: glucose-1-phosphate cytidylyltransferase [Anaerolineaceae bacterium]|nr:glucose-1-phosphate cytidylyltransferase [Anaerolineaceae bacterium]